MYPLYEDMVLATCHYDISLQYEVPFLVLGFNVYIGHRNNCKNVSAVRYLSLFAFTTQHIFKKKSTLCLSDICPYLPLQLNIFFKNLNFA